MNSRSHTATYKLARQTGGHCLFARVSVEVDAGEGRVSVGCEADALWRAAAVRGAEAGVVSLGGGLDVVITEITGLFVDTTDAAVAAATLCAVRLATGAAVPDVQRVADWCRVFGLDGLPTEAALVALVAA